MVFSFLYNFIIQSYSAFDILTKIAYELEHLKSCDVSYAKLASNGILYGYRNHLNLNVAGTVFDGCLALLSMTGEHPLSLSYCKKEQALECSCCKRTHANKTRNWPDQGFLCPSPHSLVLLHFPSAQEAHTTSLY